MVYWAVFATVVFTLVTLVNGTSLRAETLDAEFPLVGKYAGFGLSRDTPVGRAKGFFSGAQIVPTMQYGYYRNHWLLHLQLSTKKLYLQDESWPRKNYDVEVLPILNFMQSCEYSIRLYHPVYLAMGYGLSYLYPLEKVGLPAKRSPHFDAEVGAGGMISLVWQIRREYLALIRATQWRGTKTRRLQGASFEFALQTKI
jgi:hypothetical protein